MEVTTFRQKMQLAREDAILTAVNTLLASKGFELMTVDEVALEAGIAKASLYRHFPSKEDLAAAAMIRVLDEALAVCAALPDKELPQLKLKAVAQWAMLAVLEARMPSLPHANSSLVTALSRNEAYLERVFRLSDVLGEWIVEAQASGALNATLPPQLILYNLYARACDPVLQVMKASAIYDDAQIVALQLQACMEGWAGKG
ncbi:TetR/AcrR family transcriptional regulator [Chitinimonas naiadis]